MAQAIRRDASFKALLEPVLDEIDRAVIAIVAAHEQFTAVWQDGQLVKWKVDGE